MVSYLSHDCQVQKCVDLTVITASHVLGSSSSRRNCTNPTRASFLF
jgi:hypothetical protein